MVDELPPGDEHEGDSVLVALRGVLVDPGGHVAGGGQGEVVGADPGGADTWRNKRK